MSSFCNKIGRNIMSSPCILICWCETILCGHVTKYLALISVLRLLIVHMERIKHIEI